MLQGPPKTMYSGAMGLSSSLSILLPLLLNFEATVCGGSLGELQVLDVCLLELMCAQS